MPALQQTDKETEMTTRVLAITTPASVRARRWEDQVQQTADVLALIPIVNVPAGIVSGLISLRKRDYMGVALSVLELIPVEGEGAALIKLARDANHAHDLIKTGTHVVKA